MPEITFRRAEKEDLEALAAMESICFPDDSWSREMLLEEIENERNKLSTVFLHMTDGVAAFSSCVESAYKTLLLAGTTIETVALFDVALKVTAARVQSSSLAVTRSPVNVLDPVTAFTCPLPTPLKYTEKV